MCDELQYHWRYHWIWCSLTSENIYSKNSSVSRATGSRPGSLCKLLSDRTKSLILSPLSWIIRHTKAPTVWQTHLCDVDGRRVGKCASSLRDLFKIREVTDGVCYLVMWSRESVPIICWYLLLVVHVVMYIIQCCIGLWIHHVHSTLHVYLLCLDHAAPSHLDNHRKYNLYISSISIPHFARRF